MNLDLWPCAMDHAICLWNHLLNRETGILPIKLSTGQIFENYDFLSTLGCRSLCPVYGLDPTLHMIARRYLSGFLGHAKDNTWELPCDTGAQLVAYGIFTLGTLGHSFMWYIMTHSLPPCQMPKIPVWQMSMRSTLTLFLIPSRREWAFECKRLPD
jgi:hypothetical protein